MLNDHNMGTSTQSDFFNNKHTHKEKPDVEIDPIIDID